MNIPTTLCLSLGAGVLGSTVKKLYTTKVSAKLSSGFVYNAVNGLTAALILFFWGGFGSPSAFTVVLGVIFGTVTALQGVANIAALHVGPMSYTSVIISFSTLISALSGVMFFHESMQWPQGVGILLMLVSLALAAKSGGDQKRANLKWFLLCLVTFFATGGIGVMQKVHQSSQWRDELSAFLIIAFAASATLCAIFALLLKAKEPAPEAESEGVKSRGRMWMLLGILLVSGACVALTNRFNLYLSGVMDSAVFFPIINGGGLVLTATSAVVIFHERLTKKQWIGVALGIASVVFLCNPFR